MRSIFDVPKLLGESLHHGALDDFATAPKWWKDGQHDFISNNDPTDQNADSAGATVLFYNWLHYGLRIQLGEHLPGSRSDPAQTYSFLNKGKDGAFADFMKAIQALPNGVTNDNPFLSRSAK